MGNSKGGTAKTYAIGDIHGCLKAFDHLLEKIPLQPGDTIVTLGDYIDRGPDSAGVIERLIALQAEINLVCLRGNHEEILFDAPNGRTKLFFWMRVGGDATLDSYDRLSKGSGQGFDSIPDEHWAFLQCLRTTHETDEAIFVHANLDPELPLDQQDPQTMLWKPFDDAGLHSSGKVLICGHTPQMNGLPLSLPGRVCIDTAVFVTGWLTCLEISSGKYWQANEQGEDRRGQIDLLG